MDRTILGNVTKIQGSGRINRSDALGSAEKDGRFNNSVLNNPATCTICRNQVSRQRENIR